MNLIFETPKLEKCFGKIVSQHPNEEIGGILFYEWGRINNLHYKTHERIFGVTHIGMITDWIVCPNISNLRDREYAVSDLKQLIAIAEQTADSRDCMFLHFHTHPNYNTSPSNADKAFWQAHFALYGDAQGVVVAKDTSDGFKLACHTKALWRNGDDWKAGRYLTWNYARRLIRAKTRK